MTPTMLRQLWSLIEGTQTNILLRLDDTSLVQWLLRQCYDQQISNYQEADVLSDYIRSKIPLIRDLAQQR